jgi:hypothetical protein
MRQRPMNKKLAMTFLILINLFCLWVFWQGYNNIKETVASLHNQLDVIQFSSRAGFFLVVIGAPLICLLVIVEKIRPVFVKKQSGLINKCIVIGIIALFVAGFVGSSGIRSKVENAGYVYCRNASGISALERTLVYTKNMEICEKLVETKRKW